MVKRATTQTPVLAATRRDGAAAQRPRWRWRRLGRGNGAQAQVPAQGRISLSVAPNIESSVVAILQNGIPQRLRRTRAYH